MATSDSSAKQKTDTPSVDFVPSTDIWYTDGSVVLVAGKTAFRVHITIVATHCEIFKDMSAIPQPTAQDATETYEGCQVLRLQDAPVDLKHFLKSIYDFSYFRPGVKTKFPIVAAVLRLATKYIAPALRQRAIDLLSTAYPSLLTAWDQRASHRLVPPFENELTTYIELAIETDVRVILPALYYAASQAPLADVLDRLHQLAIAPEEQWSVCRAFVVGREKLLHAEQLCALAFLQPDFARPGCTNGATCTNRLNDGGPKKTLPRPQAENTDPFYRWCLVEPDNVGPSLSLCSACQTTVSTSIKNGKEKLWDQLPAFFGIPDWATLRARDGLDGAD